MKPMLTPKDIIEIFGVSKNTAYKMVRQKGFPSIKVGNRYVVRESSLEKWIETNEGREFILLESKI